MRVGAGVQQVKRRRHLQKLQLTPKTQKYQTCFLDSRLRQRVDEFADDVVVVIRRGNDERCFTGFGFKVDVRSRVVDENIDYLQGIFDVTTDDVRETTSQLYRASRLTPFCVKFSPAE